MLEKELNIVGIGEILWDYLPTGKFLGGAPANFIYHVNILGAKGHIVSSIGDDKDGFEILSKLKELKLGTDYIFIDKIHPTGVSIIKIDKYGQPIFQIKEETAWDYIPENKNNNNLALLADAVCFGSLAQRSPVSQNSIMDFLNKTQPKCLKIFDVNLRQSFYSKEIIDPSFELANIIKLNDVELLEITRMLSLSGTQLEILAYLYRRFRLDLIVLTHGAYGSTLFSSKGISRHPGFKVNVVDTVGAGDAFTAAIIIGWLKKLPLERINDAANCIGSYICSKPGATPFIPPEIIKLLSSE